MLRQKTVCPVQELNSGESIVKHLSIPLGFIAVTAVLGSACSDDRASRMQTGSIPAVVTVTTTDYAFEAPDTLQEGWTTFRLLNHGDAFHAALLVKLEEGRSLSDFREAYAEALRNGGPWEALGLLGGIVGPPPNGSTNATLHLAAGRYAWYCPLGFEDGVPHVVGQGMARPFVVRQHDGPEPATSAPEPSVTITMVDYAFQLSAPLTAGQHVIRVDNKGPEPHELILMRLAPGKTMNDVQTCLGDMRSPPPFDASLGGVVIEEAGGEAYFEAELTPGNHVLFCVISAPDGRRHWEHGMMLQVLVD
jgi:hypothetical protein